jgi:hypothetical protein
MYYFYEEQIQMETITVKNEKLYPCCKYSPYVLKCAELSYIKARYELENSHSYNSTVRAEKDVLRASMALKRIKNNVYDGVLYCTYMERRLIKTLLNEYRKIC